MLGFQHDEDAWFFFVLHTFHIGSAPLVALIPFHNFERLVPEVVLSQLCSSRRDDGRAGSRLINAQADARIPPNVEVFRAVFGRGDPKLLTVPAVDHRRQLRAAVFLNRGQDRVMFPVEKRIDLVLCQGRTLGRFALRERAFQPEAAH